MVNEITQQTSVAIKISPQLSYNHKAEGPAWSSCYWKSTRCSAVTCCCGCIWAATHSRMQATRYLQRNSDHKYLSTSKQVYRAKEANDSPEKERRKQEQGIQQIQHQG